MTLSDSKPDVPARDSARVVRNGLFNLAGMALIVPLNFVALFTLARRLGAESLGVFFTLFAISAVIFLLSGSGTTTILTRRVAHASDQLPRIIAEAAGVLTVVCMASVLLFCLAGGGWLVWQGLAHWSLLVVAAAALTSRQALEFEAAAMRGVERFEFENLARVLQTSLFCGLVLLTVDGGANGALTAYAVYAASNLAAVLLMTLLLVLKWKCRSYALNPGVLRDWFGEAWPMGVGDVLRRAAWQSETLLLAALKPPAAVGLYSLAYRPLQPLQILPRSLVSVIFPQMSRRVHEPATVGRMVGDAAALLWMLSLPAAVAVAACAKPLIRLTAGPEYAAAGSLLQALIWLTGFTFINTHMRFTLAAVGRERTYGKISAAVLGLKVAAGLACIPPWGIFGACLAALLGEVAFTAIGLTVLRAAGLAAIPWPRLAISTAAAGAMAAGLLPLAASLEDRGAGEALWRLIPASAAAAAMFLAFCVVSGAVPRAQLTRLADGLRRMLRPMRQPPPVPAKDADDGPPATRRARPAAEQAGDG